MQSLKTQGIIIRRSNFSEADRILTILTANLGKIKAIAKGSRKILSKLGGSLEPYMLVGLQLHEGKTFYVVTGASIIKEYKNIHSDIKKTAEAYFVGELIDKFLGENQKSEELLELAELVLDAIEENKKNLTILAFELKIVEVSGFKPELIDCLHCKEKLFAGDNFWDHIEGGIICKICQQKTHHGHKISDRAIKVLRFIEQNSFKNIAKLKLDQKTESEVDKILLEYIKSILERDINSREFLNLVG